ncbi:MAG: DUF1573 domain-containing protein [Flavobacteriales bacterium]|nr:DUF1573 domain-containing protein [Flavobacteriales bacterium]MCX7767915.1 DUF1573 domain-containing protein [Flavobacteriales bacterium]MDW8409319.1 DUF1573 domain-containing protein [Flavobacteriales bacterium]
MKLMDFMRLFTISSSRLLSVWLAVLLAGCQSREKPLDPQLLEVPGAFRFDTTVYDFGEIIQGQKVRHVFRFKNVGKGDLVISDAKTSCGCTVSEYPKEPVPPGEEGEIVVEFNSEGKQGQVSKTVTLYANTVPNETELKIKGYIRLPQ